MSKAKLKKYLQTLSKEQVIEVMLELYDARKDAPNWRNVRKLSDRSSSLPVASQKNLPSPNAGKSFSISKS